MFDSNLRLRTAGAGSMTSTETATAIQINATPINGLSCVVSVPKQSVGDTMAIEIQESTDNSTFKTLVTFDLLASTATAITTPITLRRRFATELKYVRTVTTVLGTSPDFGAVVISIGDYDNRNNYTVTAALVGQGV